MADLDPAAIMAAHRGSEIGLKPYCRTCRITWPCEPYRLAEALAAVPANVKAAKRSAWQQGSAHGASHMANLQHANPYAADHASPGVS